MEEEIPQAGTDATPRTTVDISGMGGSYEWFCQRMLEKGLEWVDMHTLDDDTKSELEAIISFKGCSGAQITCVMAHLWAIEKDGYEIWLKNVAAADGTFERIFEFNGTLDCLKPLNIHSASFMQKMYGTDWEDTVPDEI